MLIFDLPNWIIAFTVLGAGVVMWVISIVIIVILINIIKMAITKTM